MKSLGLSQEEGMKLSKSNWKTSKGQLTNPGSQVKMAVIRCVL